MFHVEGLTQGGPAACHPLNPEHPEYGLRNKTDWTRNPDIAKTIAGHARLNHRDPIVVLCRPVSRFGLGASPASYPDTDAYSVAYAAPNAYAHSASDTYSTANPNASANADPESDASANAAADAYANPEAHTRANPDSDTQADPRTDSGT